MTEKLLRGLLSRFWKIFGKESEIYINSKHINWWMNKEIAFLIGAMGDSSLPNRLYKSDYTIEFDQKNFVWFFVRYQK